MADDVIPIKDADGTTRDVAVIRGDDGDDYQIVAQRAVLELGAAVSVTDEETALTTADDETVQAIIVINNEDSDGNTIYVGPTGVAASGTSDLGLPIPPGVEREIPNPVKMFAICASGKTATALVYKLVAR